MTCEIVVSRPAIECGLTAVKALSPNYWISSPSYKWEVPVVASQKLNRY